MGAQKMTRQGSHNKAHIIPVVGASGTGKGRYIKTELLPLFFDSQKIVWSPLERSDNYAAILGVKAVHTLPEVIDAWKAGRSAVYIPPSDPKRVAEAFSLFCRAAWHMRGAVVLVEELSRVTTPSYAPPAWRDLSTAGRHQGITLIGTCQRPAQVDKDFFGNATEIRCFRVNYENDAKVMANVLREQPGEMMELPNFCYIHRNLSDRTNVRGILGETSKKPAIIAKKSAPLKPKKPTKRS